MPRTFTQPSIDDLIWSYLTSRSKVAVSMQRADKLATCDCNTCFAARRAVLNASDVKSDRAAHTAWSHNRRHRR